ncbi:MAG: hypothetical protein ICV68_08925, partial [Pyrinomonadaceae bacterium]|nr:hypothetical protein [Pyrinomonadaceae bacterium]
MKKPPRNFSRIKQNVKPSRSLTPTQLFIPLLALLLALFSSSFQPTSAQQRGRSSSNNRRARPTAKAQSQEAERARRAKALTLLVEMADEARTIDDLFYRARLQALAADALYPFDQQRARSIFRRAWEAATLADKAEHEVETANAGTTPDEVGPFTEARDEVLAKTAARDAALADVFLRELMKAENSEGNSTQDVNTASPALWNRPSKIGERRLALGYQMLEKGETGSAFKIVAPVVEEGASSSLMIFLLRLRERDAAAGEALYRLMLAHTLKAIDADANTVLILSTPVVSPELIVWVDAGGALQFIPVRPVNPQGGPPQLTQATRSAFFNAAASILLRQPRPGATETQDKTARY